MAAVPRAPAELGSRGCGQPRPHEPALVPRRAEPGGVPGQAQVSLRQVVEAGAEELQVQGLLLQRPGVAVQGVRAASRHRAHREEIAGGWCVRVSKYTWCLTSTETIRLIRDGRGGGGGGLWKWGEREIIIIPISTYRYACVIEVRAFQSRLRGCHS